MSPRDHEYDLIVIGSGPAGEKAAVKAAYFGFRVALVERNGAMGGAGANTGTLPSKALRESAIFYSGKYDMGLYGADRRFRGQASIKNFMYRKAAVVEASSNEVRANLKRHRVDVYTGQGHFVGPNRVAVDAEDSGPIMLSAPNIVVATGTYPFHPPSIPFDRKRVHDFDTILELDRLPRSLCIVGAGVIGCEYATIFAAMGTTVYLVN